jgi:hypothetical protein
MRSDAARIGLLAALAAVGACFDVDPFVCTSDAGCVRDGVAGLCLAEGQCAYPSEGCESGWRYSPNAGSLADACAEPEARGSSSTTTGSSNTTDASSSTGEPTQACDGCYPVTSGGRVFLLCGTASSWFDARDACSDCGLALASIHSLDANAALAAELPPASLLWIGLNDRDAEGSWGWLDGSTLALEPWAADEPSTADIADDCAVLDPSATWQAQRCELLQPYACAMAPG